MDQEKDTKNVSIDKKDTKKKKHTGLKIALGIGIPLLLIGGPIALVYGLFYDGNTIKVEKQEGFEAMKALKNVGVDSVDNSKETGLIDLNVKKDIFDQLMLQTLEGLHSSFPPVKQFLTGLGLETTDDEYTFVVDLNAFSFFKSRAKIITSLESGKVDILDQETNTTVTKDAYIFNIQDIKLGRTGFMKMFDKYKDRIEVLKDILSDQVIESTVSSLGISIKSDIENKRLYYVKEDFLKDLNKFLNNESNIYQSMLQEYFNNGLFDLDFQKDGMHGVVDLGQLNHQKDGNAFTFIDESKQNDVNFNTFLSKLSTLVDNKVISVSDTEETDLKKLYEYLEYGKDKASSDVVSWANSLDLSSVGIDQSTYMGMYSTTDEAGKITLPEKTMEEQVSEQITPVNVAAKKIATITEDMLYESLVSCNAIGEAFLLHRETEDNHYKVNAFIISDIYTNVYENAFDITITISVNGYPTYINLHNTFEGFDKSNYQIVYSVDEVMYGQYAATQEFKKTMYDLLDKCMGGASIFSIDKDANKMFISLEDSINSSGCRPIIEMAGEVAFKQTGSTMSDEGTFELYIE